MSSLDDDICSTPSYTHARRRPPGGPPSSTTTRPARVSSKQSATTKAAEDTSKPTQHTLYPLLAARLQGQGLETAYCAVAAFLEGLELEDTDTDTGTGARAGVDTDWSHLDCQGLASACLLLPLDGLENTNTTTATKEQPNAALARGLRSQCMDGAYVAHTPLHALQAALGPQVLHTAVRVLKIVVRVYVCLLVFLSVSYSLTH